MAAAANSGGKVKRLLKCFCGCKELTEDEVKNIYRLSAQGILINTQASELFHKYLEHERGYGDKSPTEEYLIIYELCEKYIGKRDKILDLDELEILCDNGLNAQQEKNLLDSIKTGVRDTIEMSLRRIQANCRNEIEASQEYKNFKQAILNKLKNANRK